MNTPSLTAENGLGMSLFEATQDTHREAKPLQTAWWKRAIHAVQYGRMIQALSGLSDDQLKSMGLKRSDIPARAHACIYGDDDQG